MQRRRVRHKRKPRRRVIAQAAPPKPGNEWRPLQPAKTRERKEFVVPWLQKILLEPIVEYEVLNQHWPATQASYSGPGM